MFTEPPIKNYCQYYHVLCGIYVIVLNCNKCGKLMLSTKMIFQIDCSRETTHSIWHQVVGSKRNSLLFLLAVFRGFRILKHSKGKGPRASKVHKVSSRHVKKLNDNESLPQQSKNDDSRDNPSTSIISREDLTLVVLEVLKALKECDAVPSRSNYDGDNLLQGPKINPRSSLQGLMVLETSTFQVSYDCNSSLLML